MMKSSTFICNPKMLVWSVFLLTMLSLFHDVEAVSKKFRIPDEEVEKGNKFWYSLGKKEIDTALNREQITNVAKNVILFLGDGMGITMSTAGRIFKGQQKQHSGEEEFLVWEKLPNVALAKTYNLDKQVADSAACATAFLTGVKGNFETLGVNGGTKLGDCAASLVHHNRATSVLKWAQDAGKDTGFVTTTRVTHATPAALYAHSAHRDWECDTKMEKSEFNTENCKDIARQLVEESPGKDANVIFGGGRTVMGSPLADEAEGNCARRDGRNLTREWLADKANRRSSAKYVTNKEELDNVDLENDDYILGLFNSNHLPYSYENTSTPTLKELTEAAIKRLSRNPKGFFLMVEGGRIDHGLHNNKPHVALMEMIAFDEAIASALDLTSREDTLTVVTADHSHTMTMNGYPERGNDILGTTSYKHVTDGMEHSVLMFTTGNSTDFRYDGTKVVRANLSGVDTRDYNFQPLSAVPTEFGYETHGGEDVAIYAAGPMSHMFHSLHDQTYVAHVMGFASCIGPYRLDCKHKHSTSAAVPTKAALSANICVAFALLLIRV